MRSLFGDDRTGHRKVVHKTGWFQRIATGEKPLMSAAVIGKCVGDGADDVVAVGDLGMSWHQFAHVGTGDVGADWRIQPAILDGSIGLHVVHFHVRRSAGQPHENHRGVRVGRQRTRLSGVGSQPH